MLALAFATLALGIGCSGPSEAVHRNITELDVSLLDLTPDGRLPAHTACGEASSSPALRWTPAGTSVDAYAVFAAAVTTHGRETLWTAYDIPPDRLTLPAHVSATDVPPIQGVTSSGGIGWSVPCEMDSIIEVVIEVVGLSAVDLPPPIANAGAIKARFAPHVLALGRTTALPASVAVAPDQGAFE